MQTFFLFTYDPVTRKTDRVPGSFAAGDHREAAGEMADRYKPGCCFVVSTAAYPWGARLYRMADGGPIEIDHDGTELVTAVEALRRVGLAELADGQSWRENQVRWTGYPQPFSCGHVGVYGFGPVDHPDRQSDGDITKGKYIGAGRRYQQTVRVSQFTCSGPVLFCWTPAGAGPDVAGRGNLIVSVTETPDTRRTCLRAGITG